MHLAEHPVEILDVAEGVGREDQVDRVGPQEGQVGEVAVAELDLDLLALAQPAGERQLLGREVDADGGGALLGEGDRALGAAAAELEHPLALEVAEQAEVGLGADVGPVVGDVGGQLRAGLVGGGVAVPRGGVVGQGTACSPLACWTSPGDLRSGSAKSSTIWWATSSWYCTGGDFMK